MYSQVACVITYLCWLPPGQVSPVFIWWAHHAVLPLPVHKWPHTSALSITTTQRCDMAITSLIAMFMGPTWGPSGADRTQVGPKLAPWTLLSGILLGNLLVTRVNLCELHLSHCGHIHVYCGCKSLNLAVQSRLTERTATVVISYM